MLLIKMNTKTKFEVHLDKTFSHILRDCPDAIPIATKFIRALMAEYHKVWHTAWINQSRDAIIQFQTDLKTDIGLKSAIAVVTPDIVAGKLAPGRVCDILGRLYVKERKVESRYVAGVLTSKKFEEKLSRAYIWLTDIMA